MNSEPRTLAGALADTLDGLDVAACIFDAGDRSLLWNRTFLTLFPEHAFKVYEGEHYSENLRRFYSARLSEAELANIDDYIKKALERHRMYDNPYQFDHQGCLIRVTTMSLLDGCRIRMRRVLEHGQTEVLQHNNPINQWVITTLLAKHGVQMTLVGDGQQALEALMVDQPVIPLDLVLMDLQMPVLDGCSATRQLRAWEAQTGRARLAVVTLTAGAFEDDRQRCLDAGMDAVLTKPLAMDQLQTTLARWLAAQPPAVAAQDAVPVRDDRPLDVARVRVLLAEIAPLLAHSKFASIACFRQLQEALAGTELAEEMAQTARLLQEFRFDLVQQRLRQLAAQQGWEITT